MKITRNSLFKTVFVKFSGDLISRITSFKNFGGYLIWRILPKITKFAKFNPRQSPVVKIIRTSIGEKKKMILKNNSRLGDVMLIFSWVLHGINHSRLGQSFFVSGTPSILPCKTVSFFFINFFIFWQVCASLIRNDAKFTVDWHVDHIQWYSTESFLCVSFRLKYLFWTSSVHYKCDLAYVQ